MKTQLNTDAETPPANVTVFIAYDCLSHGKLAKEFCDRLAHRIPEMLVNPCFWKLAALEYPRLAQGARADACSAALIIVAVQADQPISPRVRRFLRRCIRGNGVAMVAQLHGTITMVKELSTAYRLLKQMADEVGADFFSEVIRAEEEEQDYTLESIHRRAVMRTPVLDTILQWGSNRSGGRSRDASRRSSVATFKGSQATEVAHRRTEV